MAVDMSGVLKPVKHDIQDGHIKLGGSVQFYVKRDPERDDDVRIALNQNDYHWYVSKEELMNLSEAARLLAEALP